MNNLGLALYRGAGCERNLKSAHWWCKKSADLGQAEAQSNLALMLLKGEGGPEDSKEAAELFKAAADQGMPGALETLQSLQRSGAAGAAALNASTRIVQEKAAANEKEALFVMGVNCMHGEGGFAKNPKEAEKYLRKAADMNHSRAIFQLGSLLLQQGRNEEAFSFFMKSAEGENADAQWTLGFLLAFGHGCKQDVAQARRWLLRSKMNQNEADDAIKHATAVVEFESAQNLPHDGLSMTERIQRFLEYCLPTEEARQLVKDNFRDCISSIENPPHPAVPDKSTHRYSIDSLSLMAERAAQGSKTAQKFFVGLNLLSEACLHLENENPRKAFCRFREADKVWPRLPVTEDTWERLFAAAIKAFERNSSDADALYVILHYKSAKKLSSNAELLKMAMQCTNLNPDIAEFHRILGCMYGFIGDYAASVRSIDQALELENDPAWLYEKATALRLQVTKKISVLNVDEPMKKEIVAVIKEYEEYITLNEPDSREIPKAWYCIALMHFLIGDREQAEAKLFYEKGVRAESPEVMLPCFERTENFQPRDDLKLFFEFMNSKDSGEKQCANCGNCKAPSRCSRCKKAYYCSRDCQRKHWKQHKKNCSD